MARLSDEEWQRIRDGDSVHLDALSDALGMACVAVMDGMYMQGLRIVREDRADLPMDEMVLRIKSLASKIEADGQKAWDGRISAAYVVADVLGLLAHE